MSRLVFIGGFPSGGTDLTKLILNAHPEIYINGEMPLLHKLIDHGYGVNREFKTIEEVNKFKSMLKKIDEWNNLENMDLDVSNWLPIKLEDLLRHWFTKKNVTIWGNKTPQNTENMESLLKVFPSANFIIVVRDIRDICLSCRKKWGKNYYLTSARWATRIKNNFILSKRFEKNQIIYVKFEDLITKTEETTKMITDFLDIQWSPNMLEPHKHVEQLVDGKINYGKKIKPNNTEKWKTELSSRTLRKIESIAYDTLVSFDYQPAYAKGAKKLNLGLKIFGYLQESLAMIFVGNRHSANNSFNDRLKYILLEFKKRQRTLLKD